MQATFSRIDNMIGDKICLITYEKIKIIPSIFSNCNGIELDIRNEREGGKFTNMWTLNNKLLKK